jgi:acetyl-CoA C-acetyltransferase
MNNPLWILSAKRTPIGSFQGALSGLSAPQLGSAAALAAIAASGLQAGNIQEVVMGCVLSAGLGQAPARQAALGAGIPDSVPATTVNKMCGSGMKALMLAGDQIRCGDIDFALAGGIESMTNAPYLLPKARGGYRMGHGQILDHMFYDGLQSPWDGRLMGCFADLAAAKYGISRADQDEFAATSVRRAVHAASSDDFSAELTPVSVKARKGDSVVAQDETPFNCDISRITQLKPSFGADGTVTAATSSSISDGAAALVLASGRAVEQRGLMPLARVVGYASHAQQPEWFTVAPVGAIQKLLDRCGWKVADVDLFEVNEAFAVVAMLAMRELRIDHERLNVNGGACALGHPIGATGARITTTLLHALAKRGLKRGVAALCIGGGEATAIAVELA